MATWVELVFRDEHVKLSGALKSLGQANVKKDLANLDKTMTVLSLELGGSEREVKAFCKDRA